MRDSERPAGVAPHVAPGAASADRGRLETGSRSHDVLLRRGRPTMNAPTAGTLLSLNVSLPREVTHRGEPVRTGICKTPVQGRVWLHGLNLVGDGQADLKAHGGPDRAAYAYSIDDYAYWERELGRSDFGYGQFGENFTVEGLTDDRVRVGDVFRIGGALVEVSQPRTPCFKLGIKMGIPEFPRLFLRSCRTGFFMRVLEEGDVGAGDRFQLVRPGPEPITVRRVCRLYYFDHDDLEGMRGAARLEALPAAWRRGFESRIARLERGSIGGPRRLEAGG